MPKVLVTGAAGFIGRHLVPALRAQGHEVLVAGREEGDVTDEGTWARLPAADVVVHLAGKSFVPESWAKPESFIGCNLLGVVGALNFCKRHGASLVYPSSYLYGNPAKLPITEDAPLAATNPYALSKIMAEDTCRFYARNFNVPVTVLRPFNVYGPGQSEKFLVPLIVGQLRDGAVKVMDLEPRRDYVHVLDLVDAITRAVLEPRGLRVFNIGSGVSHSVAEVVDAIQQVWGTSLPVTSQGTRRPGEILDTVADVSAARRELQWQPRFSLVEGLRQIREQEAAV